MKKWLKRLGIGLAVVLIVAQFVQVPRSNPVEHNLIEAPGEIQALLQRSCDDCHSNETKWPWYARVVPMSLLIARDVKDGRRKLNFSVWERYDTAGKARKKKEIVREVKKGNMPPWYYVAFHPDAKLSSNEREIILKWADQPSALSHTRDLSKR